jgi:hypothetical protein
LFGVELDQRGLVVLRQPAEFSFEFGLGQTKQLGNWCIVGLVFSQYERVLCEECDRVPLVDQRPAARRFARGVVSQDALRDTIDQVG